MPEHLSPSSLDDPFTGLGLLPQHRTLLAASAINPEIARQRGYRSVTTKADLAQRGFGRAQQNVPALLIPLWDVHGVAAGCQIRPDTPRPDERNRPIKYESPAKSRLILDVPPACRSRLRDRETALWITEGSRKADSAASVGICCVSLQGVWGWKDADGPLPAWDEIPLSERTIYLAFDNDILVKASVHKALSRFKRLLEGRGAVVSVIVLPDLPLGEVAGA